VVENYFLSLSARDWANLAESAMGPEREDSLKFWPSGSLKHAEIVIWSLNTCANTPAGA
jgi:hypothetical protein